MRNAWPLGISVRHSDRTLLSRSAVGVGLIFSKNVRDEGTHINVVVEMSVSGVRDYCCEKRR